MTNTNLSLAWKDGPVWVKEPKFFESQLQPSISLWTQDNEEVIAPATTILTSSGILRQVISRGNYLPVAYTAPIVIVPGVTVDALKHVVEIVTTGKCDGGGREMLREVMEVLNLLEIVGEFEFLSGEIEGNDDETEDMYEEADNSNEGSVIKIETEEFIIKIEPDDTNDNNVKSDIKEDNTTPKHKNKTEKVDRKSVYQMQTNPTSRRSGKKADQDKRNKAADEGTNNVQAGKPASRQSKRKVKDDLKKVLDLNDHIKHQFKCKFCGASYAVRNSFKAHLNLCEGIYECDLCDYKAQFPSKLNLHKQAIHKGIINKCPQCEYTTQWIGALHQHLLYVHEGKTYSCTQCSFKATWPKGLKRHIQSAHEDIVYSCDSCSFKSKVEEFLKQHKRVSCPGKQK